MRVLLFSLCLALPAAVAAIGAAAAVAAPATTASAAIPAAASAGDHDELDATLQAPYLGDADGARRFRIVLDLPGPAPSTVDWRLVLAGADVGGTLLQTWRGAQVLAGAPVTIDVYWDGRAGGQAVAAGRYRVMLVAGQRALAAGEADAADSAESAAAGAHDGRVEQRWDIVVGALPAPPAAAPAAALQAAPGASQGRDLADSWQVVMGNLHSQTGHSDGGGDLANCHGAQAPQSSLLGPQQAFAYADSHGLDFLVASEHNHLYDGATGTNANAEPASARGLYQAGLAAAREYNRDHPGFVGVYGIEWGVIDHGGHLNIFNAPVLLGWERNGAGALLADVATPKGDYAALYALMRQQGWIGQFNHPAPTGQFLIGGMPLAYSADGDAAMVLCEVLNTSAFSTSSDESESRRSTYETACNKALEAGYHLAFSSDQDNHCANWGMSATNRTALLIPRGQPLTDASLLDALRARRVFATMDRSAQLIFTANEHLMGERFANRGALQLEAHYRSSSGQRAADVVLFEGVPGRNGTVTALLRGASARIDPAPGEHFYYARVTQADGKMLWSAPVWVSQTNGADSVVPTVSASEKPAAAAPSPWAPAPAPAPAPATTSASARSSSMSTAPSRAAIPPRRIR